MDEAAREARRAYFKAWRARNKDKVRQANERFWAKKAAQAAAQDQTERAEE